MEGRRANLIRGGCNLVHMRRKGLPAVGRGRRILVDGRIRVDFQTRERVEGEKNGASARVDLLLTTVAKLDQME
jgi:hypothetical protein